MTTPRPHAEQLNMLTDAQKQLIAKAKAAGLGYTLFAASVERQGWCSEKQEQTLRKMLATYEFRKNNWRGRLDLPRYSTGISDGEAMRSGDFF